MPKRGFLHRLFSDVRTRDFEEIEDLYERVEALQKRANISVKAEVKRLIPFVRHLPKDLSLRLLVLADDLYTKERQIWELPPFDARGRTMKHMLEYRDFLRKKEFFYAGQERILQKMHEAMVQIVCHLADDLPQTETPSAFTIPMIFTMPAGRKFPTALLKFIEDEAFYEYGIFQDLTDTLGRNLCEISGNIVGENPRKPWKHAHESDLPLLELNQKYLGGTPFEELLQSPVPLKLTHEDRFSHMHVVGGSGAGKTTLLEHLILHDLESDDPPSLVVVDSQGDLIRKIAKLDGIADRLILIDPKDINHPPALNIFDVNRSRTATYDEATREQVTAGVIQTFDYLFAGLLGADLTAKQGVFFKFVARLMLSLPESLGRNATILDMMHLMEDAKPYKKAIDALPPIPRSFFEKDFNLPVFRQTKEQIRYRLQAIIENPTMARLFTAPETKVDLFNEMNQGSVILVDTAKDFLKGASANYGRIFISLVLQAVLERAAIPEHERKPVFLIVDEAASYFDSNIDDLLTEARKYKCGIVLAHQYLDQTSYSLRASLAANTSIKFAAGVSNSDARAMSADMRTTPEFILDQPRLHFAAHIRNVTPQAVSIPVVPGRLAKQPQLSDRSFEEFRQRNRERVAIPKAAEHIDMPSATQVPDEDVSDKW